jgi:hypothetical protein
MLDLIRAKFPEYHPVVALAELAHNTENEEIELKCHQSIAKFVVPELKSIEVRAQVTEQRRVIVELFDEAVLANVDKPKPLAALDHDLSSVGESAPGVSASELLRRATVTVDLDPGDEDDDDSHGL